ncbi:hypothetical protein MAH1_04340 [Sessilibacter sp. MAH1]
MVSPANTTMHPDYNPIFEKLVINTDPDSKDRLIGMLAYADYKEEKFQWKEQYRQSNGVDTVPKEDVKNFLLSYHDRKLNKLRSDAEEMLYVFAEHYLEEQVQDAYEEALKDELLEELKSIKEHISSTVTKYNDGWFFSPLKSAVGSLMFAVAVFVVSVFVSFAIPDSNYSKLFQFIVGGEDFVIIKSDD